jgi:hypothetical protein
MPTDSAATQTIDGDRLDEIKYADEARISR